MEWENTARGQGTEKTGGGHLNQGQEGADNQGDLSLQEGRKLVAQALAPPAGHEAQDITALAGCTVQGGQRGQPVAAKKGADP